MEKQWLVVSGPLAQYKGSGTINGVTGYSFLLTATDGQVSGGGGVKGHVQRWSTRAEVADALGIRPENVQRPTLNAQRSTGRTRGVLFIVHCSLLIAHCSLRSRSCAESRRATR